MSDPTPAPESTPPAKSGNTPAVTSLVLGILMCIPAVTSILAIVFAVMGLRKAKDGKTGGKGLAIAGLILGIIGLIGWSAAGVGSYWAYRTASTALADLRNPGQAAASRFVRQLSEGDVNGALAEADSSASPEQAKRISLDMRQWGSFKDVAINNWDIVTVNGVTQFKLTGQANFTNASKPFSITLAKQGNTLRVVDYSFQ